MTPRTGRLPPLTETGEASAAPRRSRQRFRALNLTAILPVLAVVGVLIIALQAQTWWHAVVLGLGLAAALVAFERWTAGDLARVAIPCLIVAAAVWPFGVLVIDGGIQAAYYAVTVTGSLVVSQLPRRRILAAIGLAVYVASVGSLGVAAAGGGISAVISYVIIPTGLTVIVTGLMFPNKGFYDEVAELEEAREREAELAVVRERMRFASDLHDIQGHTLHVVKLKIALAQKLIESDPERVAQELREMYDLVGDTIAQTRELAHGRRRLNLSVELENATNLLKAAGIRVSVDRQAEPDPRVVALLAQVLRETTTNILRHARATLVQVAVAETSLRVVNDGVVQDGEPRLQGLDTLARRVSDEGGTLTVSVDGVRFLTAVEFAGEQREEGIAP